MPTYRYKKSYHNCSLRACVTNHEVDDHLWKLCDDAFLGGLKLAYKGEFYSYYIDEAASRRCIPNDNTTPSARSNAMERYTFTDSCGTRESGRYESDADAIAAAHEWAEGGDYVSTQEICVWQEERLVVSFMLQRDARRQPDDGQPDEAQEWASYDPEC